MVFWHQAHSDECVFQLFNPRFNPNRFTAAKQTVVWSCYAARAHRNTTIFRSLVYACCASKLGHLLSLPSVYSFLNMMHLWSLNNNDRVTWWRWCSRCPGSCLAPGRWREQPRPRTKQFRPCLSSHRSAGRTLRSSCQFCSLSPDTCTWLATSRSWKKKRKMLIKD